MKRLTLLCWLLGASIASAQELAVSADGAQSFQRVMTQIQQGRLGPDVTNANVTVSRTSVQLDLATTKGTQRFALLPPGADGRWSSRFFVLNLGEGGTVEEAEKLLPLLDEAFAGHDPFVVVERGVRDTSASQGVESLSHAWQRDGWRGVRTGLVLRTRQPVGPRYVVTGMLLLAAGLVASIVMVLRAKPGR